MKEWAVRGEPLDYVIFTYSAVGRDSGMEAKESSPVDGIAAVADLELFEDSLNMRSYCTGADAELKRDFLVEVSLRKARENLLLSATQALHFVLGISHLPEGQHDFAGDRTRHG